VRLLAGHIERTDNTAEPAIHDLVKSIIGHFTSLHDRLPGVASEGPSRMPLYWLCYRHNNQISVVIEPASSLIHARLRASIDGLDQGDFTEGHELDRKWRIPKEMVGRRLSQEPAKGLLAKFE